MMNLPLVEKAPAPDVVLTKALLSAAQRLGLKNREVARILGVSEASVSRLGTLRQLDPGSKEGELALLFLRLFRSLDAIVGGNEQQARAWLDAPNDHVSGVPRERICTVSGLVDVVQYLDAMRGRL